MHFHKWDFLLGFVFWYFHVSVQRADAFRIDTSSSTERNKLLLDQSEPLQITERSDGLSKVVIENRHSNFRNSNKTVENQPIVYSDEIVHNTESNALQDQPNFSLQQKNILHNPDLLSLLPTRKPKRVVAHDHRPPIRSSLGELIYPPVGYHIISAYPFSKRTCKFFPAIPLHSVPELKQRSYVQKSYFKDRREREHSNRLQEAELLANCLLAGGLSIDGYYHGPESYVFVVNPDFNLAYNNPYAYIPDTNPTAYLSLVDMVSRVGLLGGDDGDYPNIVPWPGIDLNRMIHTYHSQSLSSSGRTDLESLIKTLTRKAAESSDIERLLQRIERTVNEDASWEFRELTEECEGIHYSKDCDNATEAQELNLCYCSSNGETEVRCCDFRGRPGNYAALAAEESVFITNAKTLIMKLRLRKIRKIFIHNSTIAEADVNVESGDYKLSNLHIANCDAITLPPTEITTVSNSRVSSISAPFALEKLSLFHSTIINIEDLNVVEKPMDSTWPFAQINDASFRAESSKIKYFNNVHFSGSAVMYSCSIQLIASTVADEMYISGSDLRTVHPSGLTVVRTLSVINTRIGHLHRGAIVVQNDGLLSLKNVVIEQCDDPCFVMTPEAKIMIENLVVNGRQLEDKKSIGSYELTTNHRSWFSATSMEHVCQLQHFHWDCDMFTYAEMPLDLTLRRDVFEYLTVRDHPDIAIQEGCFRNITLKNINGSFYHSKSFRSARSGVGCQLQSQLELQNSNLTTLLSRRVGQFSATEGKSTVKYLDLGVVVRFQSTNLNIGVLEHLELRPSNPKVISFITDGHISEVVDLVISFPMQISNVTVGKVQSLVVAHFSHFDEPTVITSTDFIIVHNAGIRVLYGQLMLQDVRFKIPKENMFYLADQTQLLIRGAITDHPLNCSKTGQIISAVSRKQVLYMDALTPDWLWDCILFYKTSAEEPSLDVPDAGSSGTRIIDPNLDCQNDGPSRITCNFINSTSKVQLGGNTALDQHKTVTVERADDLTVADHCLQEIILKYVKCYHTREQRNSCFHKLSLTKTRMSTVQGNVLELDMTQSSVKYLDLNKIQGFTLKLSQIDYMMATVANGTLYRADVHTIKRLIVTRDLVIRKGLISKILNGSIVVMPGATLTLSHTRVSELETGAIQLFGKLVLNNTAFTRAYSGSILVSKMGQVNVMRAEIIQCISSPHNESHDADAEPFTELPEPKQATVILNTFFTSYRRLPVSSNCDFLQTSDSEPASEFVEHSFPSRDYGKGEIIYSYNDYNSHHSLARTVMTVFLSTACIVVLLTFLGISVCRLAELCQSPTDPTTFYEDVSYGETAFDEPGSPYQCSIPVDEEEQGNDESTEDYLQQDGWIQEPEQADAVDGAKTGKQIVSKNDSLACEQAQGNPLLGFPEAGMGAQVSPPTTPLHQENFPKSANLGEEADTSNAFDPLLRRDPLEREVTTNQDTLRRSAESNVTSATGAIPKRTTRKKSQKKSETDYIEW